jgi:para-nitrobenzyl esterase
MAVALTAGLACAHVGGAPESKGFRFGADACIAKVESGTVRGDCDGTVAVFKAIPYAAPPVGDLRWKAPVAPLPWTGLREGRAFGNRCTQTRGGAVDGDEDCLKLNVWAPRAEAHEKGWPVLVFLHGGAFIGGASSDALDGHDLYDGRSLAEAGRAVVVTVDYRLGAFGFLAHPELAREDPHAATGNYGLLDQVAALGWVQRNIGSFGGDPNRVLLFGQSAGAISVCDLIASPLTVGLFSRAAMHSGTCIASPRAAAEERGVELAAALCCARPEGALACLRSKSAAEIAKALPPRSATGRLDWEPTVDGYLLTTTPLRLFASGAYHHVALLVGNTEAELLRRSAWARYFPGVPQPQTEADYARDVALIFGTKAADQLIAGYPSASYASPAHALAMMASDIVMTCPNRTIARWMVRQQTEPVRRFVFSQTFQAGALRGRAPSHGDDLLYLLHLDSFTWWPPTRTERQLADTMRAYWVQFANAGDPNEDGAPPWPPFKASSEFSLALETPIHGETGLRDAQCDFLDNLGRAK